MADTNFLNIIPGMSSITSATGMSSLGGDGIFGSNITGKDILGASGGLLGGFGSLAGGLYSIFGNNSNDMSKLYKQQMNLTQSNYLTNLRNSVQAYNNSLTDKINGRWSDREKTQAEKDAIIEKQSLRS